jgi:hypothetical protein
MEGKNRSAGGAVAGKRLTKLAKFGQHLSEGDFGFSQSLRFPSLSS